MKKGAELVSLHLMESPKLSTENFITRYQQPGEHRVEKVRWEEVRVGAGLVPARISSRAKTKPLAGDKPLPYPSRATNRG